MSAPSSRFELSCICLVLTDERKTDESHELLVNRAQGGENSRYRVSKNETTKSKSNCG
jgi:hypothetical protein